MEGTVSVNSSLKPTVISVVLQGLNYTLWSRTIKIAICGKGLWEHISGEKDSDDDDVQGETIAVTKDGEETSITRSAADKSKKKREKKWFQEDQSVLGFLQNSLEPSILEAYSHCETAKSLWDTLKRVYGDISNLSRVYEVKKALNDLNQEDMEFKKFLGKFESTWSELDMLRPSSMDPKVLNERKEQDKIFGLLLHLSPANNDVIKSILREPKLPSFEEVCARLQKEQGNIGLFNKKNELVTANKSVFNPDERKAMTCEHCKKKGHIKTKCWILHPHLKPNKFKEPNVRANLSQDAADETGSSSTPGRELAMRASVDYVRKSDLEELIKAYASKMNGITLFSHKLLDKIDTRLVVDSGASHHMISNAKLLKNIEPTLGKVTIADGKGIPIEGTGKLKLFHK